MDVSIIIVTRNTCALTCAAVRSVIESRDGLAREIIVVDNASTDDTASVMARDFPGVKVLRCERNLGFAGANNAGAKEAQGDLLLLLNSDARLTPDSLGRAVTWMRARKECGVAGAQLLNPDGSRQNSIANLPSLATELLNKSLLRRLFPKRFPGKEQVFQGPVEVETVIVAFFLTRREVWEAVGGFDERYFFFFEETDYCLQAQRQGWKVFHLPQIEVWHDQGQTAKQWAAHARIEYWRSRYAFFRKNHRVRSERMLMAGLWVRLSADFLSSFLATLFTLGRSAKWKQKFAIQRALMSWHCKRCPDNMGLPR